MEGMGTDEITGLVALAAVYALFLPVGIWASVKWVQLLNRLMPEGE